MPIERPSGDGLISITEASTRYGISYHTIYTLIQRGRLEYKKQRGKRVLTPFGEYQLQQYIKRSQSV